MISCHVVIRRDLLSFLMKMVPSVTTAIRDLLDAAYYCRNRLVEGLTKKTRP